MISEFVTYIGSHLFSFITIIMIVAIASMVIVAIMIILAGKKNASSEDMASNLPPSANIPSKNQDTDDNQESRPNFPYRLGYKINKFLIENGYIKVHSIVKSFFRAQDFLHKVLGMGYKYKLPWYILVGEEGSGKTSLMKSFSVDEIIDDNQNNTALTWWFLKSGVVLDIHGKLFLPKNSMNANDRGWRLIFDLLVRYRAIRPLNGIILTIPADELYGKSRKHIEELKKRAQYSARKLSFAQSYVGMKLPIYIVITKSDLISGFKSFAASIPPRNKTNMLGWSSTSSMDRIYTSQVFSDAFNKFTDDVMELSLEILSENNKASTREGVLVFHRELSHVKEYLQCYVDSIFKDRNIDDAFVFRGFYFVGDGIVDIDLMTNRNSSMPIEKNVVNSNYSNIDAQPEKETPGTQIQQTDNSKTSGQNILFFDDLLLKKIFVEDGIACATRLTIKSTNKRVLTTKITTALFTAIASYGMMNAVKSTNKKRNSLYPSLLKVHELMKVSQNLNLNNIEQDGNEVLADCSNRLIDLMMQLNSLNFKSFFMPISLFSSVNGKLKNALRLSYQRIIVRTIYMNLLLKTKKLLTFSPANHSESIGDVLTITNNKEFENMKNYVSGFIELEKYIQKFDSIRTSGDVNDLNDLIDYTFAGNLPNDFLKNYNQFRMILRNTNFQAIDLSPYKKIAYDVLVNLLQQYIDTVFISTANNGVVQIIKTFVNNIVKNTKTAEELIRDTIDISESLTEVLNKFNESGECWIDKEGFTPNTEFNVFLDDVEKLFGKDVAQQVLDTVAINFVHLQKSLIQLPKTMGEDYTKDSKPSAFLVSFQKMLSELCQEPFMVKTDEEKLDYEIPDDKMVFWDENLIEEAISMSEKFKTFASTKLKKFPKIIQEGLLLTVKEHYCCVIENTIVKAQNLKDVPSAPTKELYYEELLTKQTEKLSSCSNKFIHLMQILKENAYVFSGLTTVLNKIGTSLLYAVDQLFETKQIYKPSNPDIYDWDGNVGVGYKMYGLLDSEEMQQYIEKQRSTIKHLALDYADIIVTFMNSKHILNATICDTKLLTKWTKIVENVKLFDTKSGYNSITLLENFIQDTLNGYTTHNITKDIDVRKLTARTNDYFLNTIIDIKKDVMKYATTLIKKQSINKYQRLHTIYKNKLAGKYPFYSDADSNGNEATIEDVNEFFSAYESMGGTPEDILDQLYIMNDPQIKECYEFMQRIHTFKMFFRNYCSGKIKKINAMIDVNFNGYDHVDKNVENTITKFIKIGYNTPIEDISEDKTGEWTYGTAISYNIGIHTEGNDPKPTLDPKDKNMSINSNIITFKCSGRWALLRFLKKYQSDDYFQYHDDNKRITLAFKIPLSNKSVIVSHVGILSFLSKLDANDTERTSLDLPEIPGIMPYLPKSLINAINNEEKHDNKNIDNNKEKAKLNDILKQRIDKETIHEEVDQEDEEDQDDEEYTQETQEDIDENNDHIEKNNSNDITDLDIIDELGETEDTRTTSNILADVNRVLKNINQHKR